jgi:hypothetical protein
MAKHAELLHALGAPDEAKEVEQKLQALGGPPPGYNGPVNARATQATQAEKPR